ncbi:AAA family ATPase [Chamaesiphon sp. OTE_75_metabat_556]|uniref:AAA family ATPase n=1 Tax=Chamaesiphon sp. OTE_75_metabat_556 TaxID=2964692 RepID=UPI00286A7942|nr:AAA family ATPase [Chamaesiphon sp. OTE_75_metabat_556]
MRVKELKLHNFRGIKDLHLVFNTEHNIVVLAGVNGVGKSSILDCTNLLIKHYDKICYLDFGNFEIYKPPLVLIPSSSIRVGNQHTANQIQVNFGMQDIKWEIDESTTYSFQSSRLAKYQRLSEEIRKVTASRVGYSYFYFLADRRVINSREIWTNELEYIINFEIFSKWFKETEDLENERRLTGNNTQYRHPILEVIRRSIYSLLGEGYDSLKFKRDIDKLTIKKSDREIAVDLLSDGEKSLLAMVGHLSRKLAEYNEDLENPLEASALILIDEIELHLHPAWQRMIIPRLTQTFPNCQFIVTTHSPQVLSHVDPECIHILDYDGDNVVVKRPDSSYGLDSNRILEDILGVSKRPQEIQDRMSELFRTINNNDLEGAKEIVRELGDKIGISEPELVKAEATIKRREIIGR